MNLEKYLTSVPLVIAKAQPDTKGKRLNPGGTRKPAPSLRRGVVQLSTVYEVQRTQMGILMEQ